MSVPLIRIVGVFIFSSIAIFTQAVWAETDDRLQEVIVSEFRPEPQKERDVFRHPYETLQFFELKPDLAVAEIWPTAGAWYMNILAPYLKNDGQYTAIGFNIRGPNACCDPQTSFLAGNIAMEQQIIDHHDSYGDIDIAYTTQDDFDVLPRNSVDRIFMFRALHIWVSAGDDEIMLRPLYRALKPGGIFGIVQHRADPEFIEPVDAPGSTGYLTEAYVIELFEKVGFEFVGRSEINANPKDDKDYTNNGVWRLLPTLRGADELDHTALQYRKNMGESDRMTLKFRKPQM